MSEQKSASRDSVAGVPTRLELAARRPRPCFPWYRIRGAPRQFLYYLWHTVIPYGDVTPPSMRMDHFPGVNFPSDETVRVFEALHAQAEARGSRLEAKSAALLSTAGVVASVEFAIIALADADARATAFVTGSIALLVFSMLAGYRALHVGRSSAMSVRAALDENHREHGDTKKRYALNLLNSALMSEARNDHIADFVRASALFLVLATIALLAAAVVVSVA